MPDADVRFNIPTPSINVDAVKKSEVINICSGNPISLKSHVKKWIKNKACKLKINYGFYKNSNKEIKRFWGSTKKLNKLLI